MFTSFAVMYWLVVAVIFALLLYLTNSQRYNDRKRDARITALEEVVFENISRSYRCKFCTGDELAYNRCEHPKLEEEDYCASAAEYCPLFW